jgi:hypothetical protein
MVQHVLFDCSDSSKPPMLKSPPKLPTPAGKVRTRLGQRRPKKFFTNEQKVHILEWHDTRVKTKPKWGLTATARHWDIADFRTLKDWQRDLVKLKSAHPKRRRNGQSGPSPKLGKLETSLAEWVAQKRKELFAVSPAMVQFQALRLVDASDLPQAVKDNFKASNPWLQRFMQRHGLSLRRVTGMQLIEHCLTI